MDAAGLIVVGVRTCSSPARTRMSNLVAHLTGPTGLSPPRDSVSYHASNPWRVSPPSSARRRKSEALGFQSRALRRGREHHLRLVTGKSVANGASAGRAGSQGRGPTVGVTAGALPRRHQGPSSSSRSAALLVRARLLLAGCHVSETSLLHGRHARARKEKALRDVTAVSSLNRVLLHDSFVSQRGVMTECVWSEACILSVRLNRVHTTAPTHEKCCMGRGSLAGGWMSSLPHKPQADGSSQNGWSKARSTITLVRAGPEQGRSPSLQAACGGSSPRPHQGC